MMETSTAPLLKMKKSNSIVLDELLRQLLFLESESFGSEVTSPRLSQEVYLGQRPRWRRPSTKDLGELVQASKDILDSPTYPPVDSVDPTGAEEELFDDHYTMTLVADKRRWTVGKLSVAMMVIFSLANLLLNLVDARMESLVPPDHYGELSGEGIRPAFGANAGSERITRKPRLGLGSAAISSVTTALSPILPFTGGIDLRREDYWTNGVIGSVSSVYERVQEAFSTSYPSMSDTFLNTLRGGAGAKVAGASSKSRTKKAQTRHAFALSSPQPFMPLRDIAELTLKDVAMAFQYAVQNTQRGFNVAKFGSGVAPRVKKAFEKMSAAASESRGKGVKVPTTGLYAQSGDIDALHFCAAMRIFAEWRYLRQVPEGYKGYAVGMSLGQKDIIQNVAKIEKAAHSWIDHRTEMTNHIDYSQSDLASPTLRDLLQHEVDTQVHGTKLPRLKEQSAGMGLLWVRRQLHYQTEIFANVLGIPERFESTKAAVSAAYNEIYDRYHGWAVQKIFKYSFEAAPETSEIYKVMNPRKLKEVTEAARSRAFAENAGQDGSRKGNEDNSLFGKIAKHVGRELDKFAGSVVQLFGQQPKSKLDILRGGSDSQEISKLIEMENYINMEMEKDAHGHIMAYLEVARPILNDVANLFDEFNMDDPTKV